MVSFADAIRNAFVGYAQFSGRSTRAEYWWFVLFYTLVGIGGAILNEIVYPVFSLIIGVAFILPNLAVSVRRLHDINKSGLWLLWWLLMAIGPYIIIVIGVLIAFSGFLSGNWDNTGSWAVLILGSILAFFGWIGVFIWWLIWFCKEGDLGPNQYGPDPRGDSEEIDYGGEVTETSDEGPAVGTTDELNCPTCSVGNKPNSKFCKQCGVSLDNAT